MRYPRAQSISRICTAVIILLLTTSSLSSRHLVFIAFAFLTVRQARPSFLHCRCNAGPARASSLTSPSSTHTHNHSLTHALPRARLQKRREHLEGTLLIRQVARLQLDSSTSLDQSRHRGERVPFPSCPPFFPSASHPSGICLACHRSHAMRDARIDLCPRVDQSARAGGGCVPVVVVVAAAALVPC